MLVTLWLTGALAALLFILIKPRPLRLVGAVALTAGITFSAIAIGAAWQHNPQEELHSVDAVSWVTLLGIGFSWLVAISSLFLLVGWLRLRASAK